MSKARHLIGISGGKDSAALAIYLHERHPELDPTYYYCDTGKELDETYQLLENIEIYLGKKIFHLKAQDAVNADQNPFDYFYKMYRGYLPSSVARWCTAKMKLEPFEKFVGDDPVTSLMWASEAMRTARATSPKSRTFNPSFLFGRTSGLRMWFASCLPMATEAP